MRRKSDERGKAFAAGIGGSLGSRLKSANSTIADAFADRPDIANQGAEPGAIEPDPFSRPECPPETVPAS